MKNFEIKLANDQRRNFAHLQNMDGFFRSERFAMIPEDQQELMIEQFRVQERLDQILVRRMELLGLPACR